MDSTLNLAFLMNKSPRGAYALLLGAGISKPAQIPAGWDVVRDILLKLNNQERELFEDNIGYSKLLETLGKTATERNAILREYFEPTVEDQQRDITIKTPTKAHRVIAELIKLGYIKIVLTTNFDRLLEIALTDIGITPEVIRSDDALNNAFPIQLSPITIIQLHGDYRDARSSNTESELNHYSEEKKLFLDSILNGYGLIICGWSAVWDTALFEAFRRTEARWFSTYWIEPYNISIQAQEIIQRRKAAFIRKTADMFFDDLLQEVIGLEKIYREHPLTVLTAIERTKRLMSEDRYWIDLEDLVVDNTQIVYESRLEVDNTEERNLTTEQNLDLVADRHFAACETLISIIKTMCWYGLKTPNQLKIIKTAIEKIAAHKDIIFEQHEPRMRVIPLMIIYAGGIAAFYRDNWDCLNSLLIEPIIYSDHRRENVPLLKEIKKNHAFQGLYPRNDYGKKYDAFSNVLQRVLKPLFINQLQRDWDFTKLFDLFEMVLAVLVLRFDETFDHNAMLSEMLYYPEELKYIKEFWINGAKMGNEWGFLRTFFNSDRLLLIDELSKYKVKYTRQLNSGYELPDYGQIYEANFSKGN